MKKVLAILILLTILASNSVIMTVAQETEPPRCVPEDTADTVVDSNESDIASTGANPLWYSHIGRSVSRYIKPAGKTKERSTVKIF